METLLADITNINNITVSGSNAIITISKADLLAYIQSLDNTSTAKINSNIALQTQLTAQSGVYSADTVIQNINITNNAPLITLLS